jgi:hypothetical protein
MAVRPCPEKESMRWRWRVSDEAVAFCSTAGSRLLASGVASLPASGADGGGGTRGGRRVGGAPDGGRRSAVGPTRTAPPELGLLRAIEGGACSPPPSAPPSACARACGLAASGLSGLLPSPHAESLAELRRLLLHSLWRPPCAAAPSPPPAQLCLAKRASRRLCVVSCASLSHTPAPPAPPASADSRPAPGEAARVAGRGATAPYAWPARWSPRGRGAGSTDALGG